MRSSPNLLAAATDSSDADAANSKDDDDDSKDSNNIVNIDNVEPRAVYGVSYIGGGPCGSKYNDDPFDAAAVQGDSSRPGMPDDAKERIRLLAERMKRKQEEEAQRET